jgi:hypothetical protein
LIDFQNTKPPQEVKIFPFACPKRAKKGSCYNLAKETLMQKRSILLILFTLALLVFSLIMSAPAAPAQAQIIYQTPTANSDGRILYTVADGDTCLSVILKNSITMDQLLALNNLDDQCTLTTGTILVLATLSPAEMNEPTTTPTLAPPTATPPTGTGEVCIKLFNDVNGNGIPEDDEAAIAGGAISITDRSGQVSLSGETSASMDDPTCFENIDRGDYNVSVAVPQDFNATTNMNRAFTLSAGDYSTIDFGAQRSSAAVQVTTDENPRSPLLAIFGILVMLAGVGIAVWARLLAQRR